MPPDVPAAFVQWEAFVRWLLPHTARFPRHLRFTLALRLDNLALDVVDALVEARFSREPVEALSRASLALERMRLHLRLAHDLRVLPTRSWEHAVGEVDSVGRQVGGWLRSRA